MKDMPVMELKVRSNENGTISVYSECCKAWHTTTNDDLESLQAIQAMMVLAGVAHSWTENEIATQCIPDPEVNAYGKKLAEALCEVGAQGLEVDQLAPGLTVVSASVTPDQLIDALGGLDVALGDAKRRANRSHDEGDSGWFTSNL